MYRVSSFVKAALISREAWDPAHHNPKWVDSYADPVAIRREWPARKWLVGLDPKTPKEFLSHSLRNLAYEYNASLRSCSTFPEMLVFYKEMMVRGVKMDVDTMYIILSRAARFPGVTVEQVFMLWDEMISHGVRPDLSTTEVLQTVLTLVNTNEAMKEFVKLRTSQLINIYSALCCTEMRRLGERSYFSLLQQIFHRCRENAAALNSMLSFECYATYISYTLKNSERPDILNFSRDSFDKSDKKFLDSIAVLHTVEGVLLALRYDLHTLFQASVHVTELESKSNREKESKEVYLYSIKKILAESDCDKNMLRQRVADVHMSSLQNAIYRFGTSDPMDIKRLLFFCRYIWLDISINSMGKEAMALIELVTEVYKFYGKAQATRRVLSYCWRNRLLSIKTLTNYIASIDPWEEDLRDALSKMSRSTSTQYLSKGTSQTNNEQTNDLPVKYEKYNPKSLESQFHAIHKFAFEQLNCVAIPFDQHDSLEIPIAMLWFLRRCLEAVLDKGIKDSEMFLVAYRCLNVIHNDCSVLLSGKKEKATFPAYSSSADTHSMRMSLNFSLIRSETVGDYTDIFLFLLEIIALRIDNQHINNIMEFRKEFLTSIEKDNRLLMGWLEEQ